MFRSFNRLRGRDTHLGASELSHAQFELLIELFERGELPAGELAAAARLTPATVTQMLDHLAEQGHVERVRSETDRRVVVSRLTRQGRRKIEAKREAWQRLWEHALTGVELEELRLPHACSNASARWSRTRLRRRPARRRNRTEPRAERGQMNRLASRNRSAIVEKASRWARQDACARRTGNEDGDLEQITNADRSKMTSSVRGPGGPIFLPAPPPSYNLSND